MVEMNDKPSCPWDGRFDRWIDFWSALPLGKLLPEQIAAVSWVMYLLFRMELEWLRSLPREKRAPVLRGFWGSLNTMGPELQRFAEDEYKEFLSEILGVQ